MTLRPGRSPRVLALVMAATLFGAPAFQRTETITRDMLTSGVKSTVDTRVFSLSVSKTQNLHGLEVLDVSWTGAHPTQNITPDPNDVSGGAGRSAVSQEYPVVLMQCRGIDSPDAPPGQRLDPTTCWRSSAFQTYFADSAAFPPWRLDLYATADQRAGVVGEPSNAAAACGALINAGSTPSRYWVPFKAVNGTVYSGGPGGCGGLPPEANQASGSLAFPSNETYAPTGTDGRGSTKFYVLNAADNSSLGCSQTIACSLVVVPVMGMSCDVAAAGLPPEDVPPTSTADADLARCETVGGPPQSDDIAVAGSLWWAASNWRNRVSVPLSFAPVGDPCAVAGHNGDIEIYGSELMTEATSQWDPHFCLDSSLFTLKHVQTAEPQARHALASGSGVEAVYSAYAPPGTYPGPVVNAPVALTGFAIAFDISDASGSEVTSLKLTPRLLAKLLTESYTANGFIPTPSMVLNPESLARDQEFWTLNPGIPRSTIPTGAAMVALSSDSDVMYALTSYIYSDPEARAWLDGAPDPWGAVVNPHYRTDHKEVALPTSSWPLLDTVPNTAAANNNLSGGVCTPLVTIPYLPLVAAPAHSLQQLSQTMEFAQPLAPLNCNVDSAGNFSLSALPRQSPNARFMIGVVSLGEASRLELDTASLQSQVAPGSPAQFSGDGRTFVAPSDASLRAAAGLLAPDSNTQTFQIPPEAIATSPGGAGAYPGTMLLNAEIPTQGLPSADAQRYSQFLQFAAGPGQTPGTETGQLPAGYLPMTAANGMGRLVAYTQAAAKAVAAQDGTVPPVDPNAPASPTPSSSSSGPGSAGGAAGASAPSATSSASTSATAGPPASSSSVLGFGSTRGGLTGGGSAQQPVQAPGSAPLGPIGKTIAIISHIATSLVRWLLYLAGGALAGAAGFYVAARRRGMSPAAIREWLRGIARRRRSPG